MVNEFVNWFDRSQGRWTSHRRYLYGPKKQIDNLVTEFSIKRTGDYSFGLEWGSDRNTGEMNFTIDEDLCRRDIGYYTNEPTDSKMSLIDKDTVVFETSYGGTTYREEIRLLFDDSVRLRQTVGVRDDGKISVVGQYYEERTLNNNESSK